MGCFSCIRCSCGGKCMGCCSCSTCSCGGKCTGCSSCITCSCWGKCIGCSSCSGCKDGGKCNCCPSCSGCSNGGKCIGCSSCSGCSNGGKCMGCFCCCKSSNEEKDPTRRKKKWNPFSCLACKGKKMMGCSCCHKSGHKAKEPSTRPEKKEKEKKEKEEEKKEKKEKEEKEEEEKKEKKEKEEEEEEEKEKEKKEKDEEEKKGTKSCLCIGKCWCERKKSAPSGVVKERKNDKKKKRSCLSCLVCRGEKGLCCSCCGKSSDENKKPPEEEEKEQREGKKRSRLSRLACRGKGPKCCLCCAKSSDEESKKKKKREPRKGSSLAFLVHNMSFKSDSGKHRSDASEILRIGNGNIAARMFQFQELAVATENFKSECLLGEGGFGRVYQGYFEETNQIVAVKQLDRNGFQGNREFLVEVLMLSLLHHPNLVNLLGYCADGEQRILVYEYMSLGSLEDHLLAHTPNSKPLDWNARMKIALGAAKGIEYLHDIANPPVIYRDLKASNILLDEEYNPKLSDFGLAKLGPVGDKTHVSTRVMGTYGYCAPEYALTGQLTKMSDVYSFGVVFLELITGRRAIDITRPTHEQHLVQWAGPLFKDKTKFPEMADPLLQGKYPLKGMYQALAVAAMCLQEEATIRPRMSDVVTALEYLSLPFDISTEGSKEPIPRLSLSSNSEVERITNGNEGKPEEESCNSRRELEEDVDISVPDTIDDGNTRLREP